MLDLDKVKRPVFEITIGGEKKEYDLFTTMEKMSVGKEETLTQQADRVREVFELPDLATHLCFTIMAAFFEAANSVDSLKKMKTLGQS